MISQGQRLLDVLSRVADGSVVEEPLRDVQRIIEEHGGDGFYAVMTAAAIALEIGDGADSLLERSRQFVAPYLEQSREEIAA